MNEKLGIYTQKVHGHRSLLDIFMLSVVIVNKIHLNLTAVYHTLINVNMCIKT